MNTKRIAARSAAFLIALGVTLADAAEAPKHGPANDDAAPTLAQPRPQIPVTSPHELTSADVSAWLDGLMNYSIKAGDIAGAVLAVVKDGQVLFQSGYGYADVDKKIPIDPERTLTRIGSTSKLFTWTAVM